MKAALLICAVLVAGCVHAPIAHPAVPVVTVLPVQAGDQGFYFDEENKNYLVTEGVPAAWFLATPRGWYLSKLQEIQAAAIREKARNP